MLCLLIFTGQRAIKPASHSTSSHLVGSGLLGSSTCEQSFPLNLFHFSKMSPSKDF